MLHLSGKRKIALVLIALMTYFFSHAVALFGDGCDKKSHHKKARHVDDIVDHSPMQRFCWWAENISQNSADASQYNRKRERIYQSAKCDGEHVEICEGNVGDDHPVRVRNSSNCGDHNEI